MQRERQEDVVLNKVLWWIVGAVVLEFLLLLLNRFYSYYTPDGIALAQALRTVFTVLGIVLPLCFLALLAWYRSARRSGKGTRLSARWSSRCSAPPASSSFTSPSRRWRFWR